MAEIDAVLDLKSRDQESWELKWNNSGQDEKALMTRVKAITDIPKYYGNKDFDQGDCILFFLLSNIQTAVNFQKTSPGGIMGRQYMRFKDVKSMDELLARIKDKQWRSVKDWG